MTKIRTRFAPSPTGDLHIGGLRTALYSYALAKNGKGSFILRIEDTDKKREVPNGKEKIQEILKTFGLGWDEYFVQSERLEYYKKAAQKLLKEGNAYEDEGAIRIKIPRDQKISFRDYVLGKEVSWDTNTLTDLVLLKSDGYPTYHLAVVVDDNDMGITHVLRGHDWLPSTPIHLLIYKFLGYDVPQIGHLTDILDPDGGKLSKRKGSTSCMGLMDHGYLPEAILNFVMLLGWAPKDNREIFSLNEFVKDFDPEGFQKANPIFNREKLDWFNGYYIRQKTDKELFELLKPFVSKNADEAVLMKVIPLIKDRIKKLSDFENFAGFFFTEKPVDLKLFGGNYKTHLAKALEAIEASVPLDNVPKENDFKIGDFFMDLRIAITGSKFTPPINESIEILGKEETIKRLGKALKSEKQ
jgi:glutamyl-tRNA synthetase